MRVWSWCQICRGTGATGYFQGSVWHGGLDLIFMSPWFIPAHPGAAEETGALQSSIHSTHISVQMLFQFLSGGTWREGPNYAFVPPWVWAVFGDGTRTSSISCITLPQPAGPVTKEWSYGLYLSRQLFPITIPVFRSCFFRQSESDTDSSHCSMGVVSEMPSERPKQVVTSS